MKSIQVIVPYLGIQWAVQDMLVSFGDSDIPVLIIDNSPNSDLDHKKNDGYPGFVIPRNVTIEHYPQNIGVSASWNKGLIFGADQTLIVSQWVRFSMAELGRRIQGEWGLNYIATEIQHGANDYGMTFGDQGFHLISIGRKTVQEIGLFDENFRYFGNDDDYLNRMRLKHITMGGWIGKAWNEVPIHSIAFAVHQREGAFKNLSDADSTDYYNSKWGAYNNNYPGEYELPFNNIDNDLKYWPSPANGSGLMWDSEIGVL